MRLLSDGNDEKDGRISRNAFPEGVSGLFPAANSRDPLIDTLFLTKSGLILVQHAAIGKLPEEAKAFAWAGLMIQRGSVESIGLLHDRPRMTALPPRQPQSHGAREDAHPVHCR